MDIQPQGMLSSAPQQSPQARGYSGIIDVKGEKVLVNNGSAKYKGENFRVYGNGEAVIDSKNQIVGTIVNQSFKPLDSNDIYKLKKSGMA